MIGIYVITNSETNKIYIGKSCDIYRRWKAHNLALYKNKHDNIDLQEDWNKYGEDSFSFAVMEECAKDVLTERENFWINTFNATKYGYNFNSKKTSDKKWNKSTKNNKNKEMLLNLCSKYLKKNAIGSFHWKEVCDYMHMNDKRLYNLIHSFTKSDFENSNIFIHRNYDSEGEYVSFTNFDFDHAIENPDGEYHPLFY